MVLTVNQKTEDFFIVVLRLCHERQAMHRGNVFIDAVNLLFTVITAVVFEEAHGGYPLVMGSSYTKSDDVKRKFLKVIRFATKNILSDRPTCWQCRLSQKGKLGS